MQTILLGIFIIFAGAKLVGEIFERLGIPVIIGEILLGITIGAFLPQLLRSNQVFQVIAQLGAIVLLFSVGLETPVANLLKIGGTAARVAVLGVIFPFALGLGLASFLGYPTVQGVFLAASMVATSIGITARVLSDLGVIDQRDGQIILGAAVIDDILGLVLLAVITGFGKGALLFGGIGALLLEVLLFVGVSLYFGTRLTKNHGHHLDRLRIKQGPLAAALIVCFGMSFLAGLIGMAAIVGAFLAGVIFAELGESMELNSQLAPIYEFLVPFFFVMIGAKVSLGQLTDPAILKLAAAVAALAIVGKLAGGGLGAINLGRVTAIRVGAGMIPHGEVGIIVALMGVTLGVIPSSIYAVIIIMSILTTLVSPIFIRRAFGAASKTPSSSVKSLEG